MFTFDPRLAAPVLAAFVLGAALRLEAAQQGSLLSLSRSCRAAASPQPRAQARSSHARRTGASRRAAVSWRRHSPATQPHRSR